MRTTLNIGLQVTPRLFNTLGEVLTEVRAAGIHVGQFKIANSTTEPTVVIESDDDVLPQEAYRIAKALLQDCIAVENRDGTRGLYGPRAEKWLPFNPEFFITF